jgi:hypothetical protein
MPAAVDQVADTNGVELFRLSQLYPFPEFVKKADLGIVMKPGPLAVTVYADAVRRQFPCHNAASTWVSAAYFFDKRAEFHPKDAARIEARLDHYVDYWRIRPAVETLRTKHAEYTKSAADGLPDSAYAYVWVTGTGLKERRLPLTSAVEVKLAADYLHDYADRFDFKTRNTMAGKIMAKAAALGAGLGERREWLEKTAGLGVGDPKAIVAMIEDRAKLATQPEFRRGILKLAEVVRTTPRSALAPATLADLCHTVEQIDRTLGVYGKYAATIPRPEDVIFAATFSKAAAELNETCALTSGNAYRKEQFSKLALDDLRALFGDDFAEQVKSGFAVDGEKLAELAHTLPRGDAELFDRMMSDCGLHPVMAKAASVRQGFTPADYAKMAEQYVAR